MTASYVKTVAFLSLLVILLGACSAEGSSEQEILSRTEEGLSNEEKQRAKKCLIDFYDAQSSFHDADILYKLTHNLIKLVANAKIIEQEDAEAVEKGEKPAVVEGEVFASLYEGYTHYELVSLDGKEEECRATVEFTFAFDESSPKEIWRDEVVIIREKGEWKIDNVIYGKGRNYPVDLKSYLKLFIAENYK